MNGKRAATCPLILTLGELPYWCSQRRLSNTKNISHNIEDYKVKNIYKFSASTQGVK